MLALLASVAPLKDTHPNLGCLAFLLVVALLVIVPALTISHTEGSK
jgi:hypothetical protein